MIVRVEPLVTTRRVTGPFDYRAPEGAEVGTLLRVPFGGRVIDGVVTGLAAHTDVPDDRLADPARVHPETLPAELVELALWVAHDTASTSARALALALPPGLGRVKPRQAWWATAAPEAGEERLTDRQRDLLATLPRFAGPDLAALRRLEARGLVALGQRVVRRSPSGPPPPPDRPVTLTPDQEAAVAALRPGERHVLHGVTGSGKTEVYLRAAEAALGRGEGVMVLVPEIALTPQTVGRFRARFGEVVALLHSAMSDGERYDEWLRLRRGEARIVVGPRSAVWAPVRDLGLVVIDEEHDPSFKQEGDPRYDARRIAERRAEGGTLIAGSATPRPESVHRLHRVRLPDRVDGRPLPPVELLDLRGHPGPLHPDAATALASARKAVVLVNRRGWSNFLTCRDCGKAWTCPNCDVALVLHRARAAITCHHCGHGERVPGRCDECGSLAVARHGAGTERLEADLAERLGKAVFRLDADTATVRDGAGSLLAAFAAARDGVLLGTQLVAKGHDFPDIELGVVVDADATLRFPDFRAEERTFAMVTQLAGRVGRGRSGRVLVQTLAPDAESLRFAARHDADGFLRAELARREALRYPPFAELVRVICTSVRPEPAAAAIAVIADAAAGAPASEVLGPAPLFRLRGRERMHLLVKTTERAAAVAILAAAVEDAARTKAFHDVAFSVDVDPQ